MEFDLDKEDVVLVKGGRRFKLIISEGFIEYSDSAGRKYYRVMLEELR